MAYASGACLIVYATHDERCQYGIIDGDHGPPCDKRHSSKRLQPTNQELPATDDCLSVVHYYPCRVEADQPLDTSPQTCLDVVATGSAVKEGVPRFVGW